MSIETVINQVVKIQKEIDGVRKAYEYLPSSINAFPCFVNFPDSGDMNVTPSRRETRHTIRMLLYMSKADTIVSDKNLRPFIEKVLDKFDENVTIGGKCSYSRIRHYDYGMLMVGNVQYLGISFELEAVELEGKTFS